jgi:hypothetical protein
MFDKYLINPKEGDIVDIYSCFSDKAIFMGKARLIHYVDSSDSLYLDYEKLNISSTYFNSLTKISDPHQNSLKIIHSKISNIILNSKSKILKEFKSSVVKATNRKITSYNNVSQIIDDWRKHNNSKRSPDLKKLLEIENRYLIRYFQQTTIKNWTNSVFILQKWKVEILPKDKFEKSFTTTRKLPVLIQTSPQENAREYDLAKYTTYSGKRSNFR